MIWHPSVNWTLKEMEKFVSEQKKLLALERDAEIEESRLLQSSVSLRELCQKGVAVQKLVVGGQATGLYGRLVITWVSRLPGSNHELPSHNITSGDIVGVRQGSGQAGTSSDMENISGRDGKEIYEIPYFNFE